MCGFPTKTADILPHFQTALESSGIPAAYPYGFCGVPVILQSQESKLLWNYVRFYGILHEGG